MDVCDITEEKEQTLRDAAIAEAHQKAINIPLGIQGECGACGDYNPRLIQAYNPVEFETQWCCSPCRDKFSKVNHGRNPR